MKRLLFAASVGILIGYVAGSLASMLPPVWSMIAAGAFCVAVWMWALHSLREMKDQQDRLDRMMMELRRRGFDWEVKR